MCVVVSFFFTCLAGFEITKIRRAEGQERDVEMVVEGVNSGIGEKQE